jgi:hypothetical protein
MSAQRHDDGHLETTVLAWLAQLYDHIPTGWLTLFSLRNGRDERVDWAAIDDYDTLVEHATKRATDRDVWFGVATRKAQLLRGRGGRNDCAAIPGLWLDLDVAGPAHKTTHTLPPTFDAAHELLASFPLPPTTIVHSGHGLQPYWLLAEPIPVDKATDILKRWGHTWSQRAGEHGWHLDSVFDVARILRLPGTYNHKVGEVHPVEVLEADWSLRYGVDDLDQFLVDPPARPPRPERPPRPPGAPLLPGEAFNLQHGAEDVLRGAGWALHKTDPNGNEHWTRPGKETGTSATVYKAEDGHVTIWSSSVPGVETERPYDAFGIYTQLRHNGDHKAASDELERHGYGTKPRPDDLSWITVGRNGADPHTEAEGDQDEKVDDDVPLGASWAPTDIATVLAGIQDGTYTAPEPALGEFCNAEGALWYAGRVNALYGESGTGKTWVAIAVAAETMSKGGTVAWVDLEEPAEGILHRLLALGLSPELILERFIHFAPDEPISAAKLLTDTLDTRPPDLVVIDSTGEGLALEGAKPNNDDEVANWMRSWARWPAARWDAAVVLIDHVIKDVATRGLNPGGSQRKKAAITGSAFMVEAITELGKGRVGLLKLTTAKDRNGRHIKGHTAAEFTLDASRPVTTWKLEAPVGSPSNPGEFRPTTLMGRVSAYLAQVGESSAREVEKMVPGKGTGIRQALAALVDDGYAERIGSGNQTAYRHRRLYDSTLEWVRDEDF